MADIEKIAREYLEAWNRRDWDTYRGLMHDQYSYTGGDGQRQSGPEAGMAVGQMFANAFPDGRIEVKRVQEAGDTAIVEFLGVGTHNGELMGIKPTGRKISIPVCDVIEFRDGKVVAEREYMDMLTMMQQLGVAPAPASTTA
jgi:steroid delta-isomerase-like uncharacterized protein